MKYPREDHARILQPHSIPEHKCGSCSVELIVELPTIGCDHHRTLVLFRKLTKMVHNISMIKFVSTQGCPDMLKRLGIMLSHKSW